MAESLGTNSAIALVQSFSCLAGYDDESVALTLYSDKIDEVVANALSWFVLEECACSILEDC